jgi:hypothetical protein
VHSVAEQAHVFLIQMLLPITAGVSQHEFERTRDELVERFGGVTAYVQTPAQGLWTRPDGRQEADRLIMVEVVAPAFDRSWWHGYASDLAARFDQQVIHVRALAVDVLDPQAV